MDKQCITNKGIEYKGFDGAIGLQVQTEETVWVSSQKAKQLLEDFPNNWVEVEEVPEEHLEAKSKGRPKKNG